ncbi:MAG: helix-turn-helix transcriptional regulator [Clostridia bacterium]|nr:helix-turn-helix transcriptional regulator [Clostridia bacterium]
MNIYERIKALRIKNGMSQYDLALKVGYEGRSAISKVEQGKRDISQSMIVKYADALGVTPAYLLYGDEEQETPATDNGNGRTTEFDELFQKLTAEQQMLVISQIKGILSNQ